MKFPPLDYRLAPDLRSGCELLAGEDARPLAGGQSLLPLMALRMARPGVLVDISRLEELRGITVTDPAAGESMLRVGAMTTHAEIEHSPTVAQHLPILSAVATHIGHVAIRHLGTIGGSVAHADPAAEWPATCVALGAQAQITSVDGVRYEPVEQLLSGPYQTSLRDGEIISRLDFPLSPRRRFGFSEVAIRAGDFALAGAVCVLEEDGQRTVGTATVFGVEGQPRRLPLPALTADLVETVDSQLGEVLQDLHADAAFRRHLAVVAVRRALADALAGTETRS